MRRESTGVAHPTNSPPPKELASQREELLAEFLLLNHL
jgi:hypothetical protein